MKNICLFDTGIGSLNIGDEIIMESTKKGLRSILYDASVFRLGTHVVNFNTLQMLRPGGKIRFLSDKIQYKFICGTSLIVPSFSSIQKQFALSNSVAALYKDSILVGAGKVSEYDKLEADAVKMYKKVLSKEHYHSVRDEAAKDIIEGMGLKALNTGCPTLWEMTKEKCAGIPTQKAENVIFSVSGQEKYHDKISDGFMIETLKKNYGKLYAWIQTSDDENYLRSLTDPEKENIELVYSLEKYADILDGENVEYVGTRLHGGIFALQHSKRSLIIAIDHRARGFKKSNNIPVLDRSEIESLDDIINSPIITDIKLDFDAIEQFLAQFV